MSIENQNAIQLTPIDEADATLIGEKGPPQAHHVKSVAVVKPRPKSKGGGWSLSLAEDDDE